MVINENIKYYSKANGCYIFYIQKTDDYKKSLAIVLEFIKKNKIKCFKQYIQPYI